LTTRYRFDRFELVPAESTLYAEGQAVAVGARALQVLDCLVQRAGQLVPKSDLIDAVWPGVVVEDNNLQVQVSALRKVLGPAAIATVAGRGYRFTLPVQGGGASDAGARRLALPAPIGPVWGREDELQALGAARDAPWLTTILGRGGKGKTTLALQVAHAWASHFRDGVAWVSLAELIDPTRLPAAVAQALGLPVGRQDPWDNLLVALQSRHMLLVLDNAEHLVDAVAHLAQAVQRTAPAVRLLVTSQVPLHLDGEREFHLQALPLPADGDALESVAANAAVVLFVREVQELDHSFKLHPGNMADVITVCRRLDGLPLALKLAAARVPLLGLSGTLARLDERFRLLAGGARTGPLERQQALLAALDWSHDLLSPDERAVFRRLSVCCGGFSLEVAQAARGDETQDDWVVIDILGRLVERSLVVREAGDPPRFRLPESVLDHARLKLDMAGERALACRHHAHAVGRLMAQAHEAYWSSADEPWLDRYAPDIDNVRQALDWAEDREPRLAVQLIADAALLLVQLGQSAEGRQRAERLCAAWPADIDPKLAGRFQVELGRLCWGVDGASVCRHARAGLTALRAVGDARGQYLALRCLAGSGVVLGDEARALLDDMGRIEQADWPVRLRLQRLLAKVGVLKAEGLWDQVQDVCRVLGARAQAAGLHGLVAAAHSDLAAAQLALGDPVAALASCRQVLAGSVWDRDPALVHAHALSATACLALGNAAAARTHLQAFARASWQRDWAWFGHYQHLLQRLATLEGRAEVVAQLVRPDDDLDPEAVCALVLGIDGRAAPQVSLVRR